MRKVDIPLCHKIDIVVNYKYCITKYVYNWQRQIRHRIDKRSRVIIDRTHIE